MKTQIKIEYKIFTSCCRHASLTLFQNAKKNAASGAEVSRRRRETSTFALELTKQLELDQNHQRQQRKEPLTHHRQRDQGQLLTQNNASCITSCLD